MKTKLKKSTSKGWALPGESLTMKEFDAGIKKAEKGPFDTIEDAKKMITQWRKQRNSK